MSCALKFYAGDSFSVPVQVEASWLEGQIEDFTGWSGFSQLRRAETMALIADLEFAWLDAAIGLVHLKFEGDTSRWAIGGAVLDVELLSPAGQRVSSQRISLEIERGVTDV